MRLWVSHVGHQTFKINEDLGQFLTETTFELQISHIQCYYGYLKVLILIFLIALRLFQSRDYPFKTTTTTATQSDWLSFQPKRSFIDEQSGGLSCEGGGEGGGGCRHHLRFMAQVRQVEKWQLAQKEKSPDFKSPDLGSSPYTLIN